MWNVNTASSTTIGGIKVGFYFNYVECKYENVKQSVSTKNGFILTMWNVNCTLISFPSVPISCFILTMWNVNYIKINTESRAI